MRLNTPPVRHASGHRRTIWPGLFRLLAVAVTVVLISGGSVAAYSTWLLTEKVRRQAVPIPGETVPPVTALDGSFNVLLVGADNAAGQHSFGKPREAALNDVNILIHVSKDHSRGTVISFPRDLVIPHPACSDPKTGQTYPAMAAQPLNAAFERGGLGCVVGTIEHLTDLTIPYAALFSFAGTVKMADAVGGVPVCVTTAINDPKSGLRLKKGTTVISGRTALAYLRERKLIGDGSDLGRIASQQAYMSALLRQMTSAGTLADPTRLFSLANAAADNVSLSESMAGLDRMVQMALAIKTIDLDHMVFIQYPTGADPANPSKVIPDEALATRLINRVRQDKRVTLSSGAVGISATTAPPPTSPPSRSATLRPTPTATDRAAITGLTGTTAAQRTCTVTRARG